MTEYHLHTSEPSPITLAARASKAKRKAQLEQVWARRAQASAKKTVGQWVEVGKIIRGSELKKQNHTP
jgi:hypothetical protein